MNGEIDLSVLVKEMTPKLHKGEYVLQRLKTLMQLKERIPFVNSRKRKEFQS